MTKSRSPLWTICPSLKWISVSVPPTWARSSTRSIAENWPRKPSPDIDLALQGLADRHRPGWASAPPRPGFPVMGRKAEPGEAEARAPRRRRAPLPSIATGAAAPPVHPAFSFEVRRVADLIHETVRESLPCCPEFGCGGPRRGRARGRSRCRGGGARWLSSGWKSCARVDIWRKHSNMVSCI